MISKPLRLGVLCLVSTAIAGVAASGVASADREPTQGKPAETGRQQPKENVLTVQYLEVVTPSVDETCEAMEKTHGLTFGEPIAELGNARTAELRGGGRIGVRAPMGDNEEPVVRPYALVDDIEAAVEAAQQSGAQVAMPPTEIPGHGTFSIYFLGGIQHGLWQH